MEHNHELRYEGSTHTFKELSSPPIFQSQSVSKASVTPDQSPPIYKGIMPSTDPVTSISIWYRLRTLSTSHWLSTSHCCPLLTLYTALSHRNAQLSLDLVSTSFHTQYSKQRVFHNNFLWWKIDTAKSRLLTALCTLLRMCPRFRRWDHAHSTELTNPRTTRAPAVPKSGITKF